MKRIGGKCSLIADLKYGERKSEIYWFPDKKSLVEFIEIRPDLFLLQGSREYYIKDVHKLEDFQKKYGLEGDEYHSRLASIGTFSEYLKEAVPSFELYVLYINSLSSNVVRIDNTLLTKQIKEVKKRIDFKKERLNKLKFEQESGLSTGREMGSLKNEINELTAKLSALEEEKELNETLAREYKRKGMAATFIIRAKSPARIANGEELGETLSGILDDLQYKNKIIKAQAWHGFRVIIEDLDKPALGLSARSIGLLDPRSLDELIKDYGLDELEDLKTELEELLIYRAGKDIKVGDRYIQESGAIAQGIAAMMRRAVSKPAAEKELPQPDFSKLPSLENQEKRLGYMGFILENGVKTSQIPYLFDFDEQGPQHTLIVGGTGSGKTVCASDIVEGALIHNIPVLVLDTSKQWTGFLKPCQDEDLIKRYDKFEMREVDPTGFNGKIYTPNSETGINLETNLLARPETNKRDELQQCAYEMAAIIKSVCDLTSKEATYLRAVILDSWEEEKDLNYITLRKELEEWGKVNEKNVFETKLKLEELEGYPFLFSGEKLNITEAWSSGEISVVSLDHLTDTQKVYTSYFLMRELLSYFYSQPDTQELKLMLILEEAHRFIPKNTPGIPQELYLFLDRVIRELRRKGIGTIFISQVMTDFKESIRANTATKIRLRTSYEGDLQRASKDIGSEFANYLPKLKTGQGVVSFANYGNPFFVQFRPPLHHPFALENEEIQEEMRIFKEADKVQNLLRSDVEEIRELSDKDLRAIKSISPKIYNVVKFIRATGGVGYVGDASKLLSAEFNEIKNKLEEISAKKLDAIKELSPDVYEIIENLKKLLRMEREFDVPEEELVLQKIKEIEEETGLPPKPSDIVTEVGWGWKKVNSIIEKLEDQGRIKKKKDKKDKRIRRLILLD
ncbi:MAG: helicase HerA-like domain-containing protein [Candidatus Cloacimonadia bacterium]